MSQKTRDPNAEELVDRLRRYAEPLEHPASPDKTDDLPDLPAKTGEGTNPLAILAEAVRGGTTPETLERLTALAERWQAAEARQAYAVAMRACQAELPRVVRDGTNPATRSRYARLESIQHTCREVWQRHGFSISFSESPHPREGWVTMAARVTHVGGHSEDFHRSGPMDDAGMKGRSNKTGIQAVASTASYLRRYLLLDIFDIVLADADTDGQASATAQTGYVTADQARHLADLIRKADVNLATVLNWGGCEVIDEFPARLYDRAVEALRDRMPKESRNESEN